MPLPIITTLGDREVGLVLARAQESSVRARQADAEKRLQMLQENFLHLGWAYANTLYKTEDVRKKVRTHTKRTFNVLKQICNRVCVAYKVPPLRELKDAPEASQRAFAKMLKDAKVVTKAKKWERYAFAMNVIVTVPRVVEDRAGQGKRVVYDTITPDRCEVYTDADDPLGDPTHIAYVCKNTAEFTAEPLSFIVLDDEAWHHFDAKGRRVAKVEHGAGIFPGTVWRSSEPDETDWWDSFRGSGVVDAGITVQHLAARMDYVRHGQDRKKEYAAGQGLAGLNQQVAGSEAPVEVPLPPTAFSVAVLDVNTPVTNHLEHIRVYLHQAAESLGIPSVLVDFDPSATNYGNVTALASYQQHEALAELRAAMIEFYRVAEHDSAWKTALVMRGMQHPDARLLEPDMVKERFAIAYPELTFVQDPMSRANVAEKRIAIGLSSTVREYHREHPELTYEQAKVQVLAIAKEEGELNELYIRNNWPRGQAQKMNLPQAQGQQGGFASGESRNNDDEDEDEDDADGERKPGRADGER